MKFHSISILIIFMLFIQRADFIVLNRSMTQKHNQRLLKSKKTNRKTYFRNRYGNGRPMYGPGIGAVIVAEKINRDSNNFIRAENRDAVMMAAAANRNANAGVRGMNNNYNNNFNPNNNNYNTNQNNNYNNQNNNNQNNNNNGNSNGNSGPFGQLGHMANYKVAGIPAWQIVLFLGFVWMIILFIILVVLVYEPGMGYSMYKRSRKLKGDESEKHNHLPKGTLQRKLRTIEKKLEKLEEKKVNLQEKNIEKTDRVKRNARENDDSDKIVIRRIHTYQNQLDLQLAKLEHKIDTQKDLKMDLQLDLLAVNEHESQMAKRAKLRKLIGQFKGGKKPVWEILLSEKRKVQEYLEGKGVNLLKDRSYGNLVNQVIEYTKDEYAVEDGVLEKARSKALSFKARVMKMPNMKSVITG